MNIALRVLVIVVLVLNITAFVFSTLLYSKRSMLLERVQLMQEQMVKVSKTLEAQDPADPASPPTLTPRDIAKVTEVLQDNPEMSSFWDSYATKLEQQSLPVMEVDSSPAKKLQLSAYYKLDAEGKPEKDALGNKISEGPGTMREVLNQIYDRAKAQNALLNKTRGELSKVREELVGTIVELNAVKQDGRQDKKTIVELKERIVQLETELAEKVAKIQQLEQRMRELEVELTDAKAELEVAREKLETASQEIASLKKALEEAIKRSRAAKDGAIASGVVNLTAGVKGKVIACDDQLKFAIVELSPETMKELQGEALDQPLPQVDMLVRRDGFDGPAKEFITRIRLRQAIRGQNMIICDILSDWQQAPVEKNDVVFF